MEELSSVLTDLAHVLAVKQERDWWADVLSTLPAALLAAFAAVAAAKFTVYFDRQSLEKNVAISIYNEVVNLKGEIDRCASLYPGKNFTYSDAIEARGNSCPIYISLGSNLGCLNGCAISEIVKFYSLVLTVPAQEGGAFLKADLASVSTQAQKALSQLRQCYPNTLN